MSIINKVKIFFILSAFLFSAISAEALSIRIIEGVPLGNYKAMVEEGLRLGNIELLKKAWQHYEKAIKFDEEEGVAASSYLELGKIYFYLSLLGSSTDDEYFKAENYARRVLKVYPQDPDAHRALGLIFAGRGAYVDAFEEFSLALKLNPANDLVICDMASLHLALHQPNKTIDFLENIRKTSGWSQILLAMAYSQKNMNGRAMLALSRAEKMGYNGYWVDTMRKSIAKKLNINF